MTVEGQMSATKFFKTQKLLLCGTIDKTQYNVKTALFIKIDVIAY